MMDDKKKQDKKKQTVTIDNVEYNLEDLSDNAKAQLATLEEGSVNILEDLTVRTQGDNQLYLSIALNQIEKKKMV